MTHMFKCVCGEVLITDSITRSNVFNPAIGVNEEVRTPVLEPEQQKFFDGHNSSFGHSLSYIMEMS